MPSNLSVKVTADVVDLQTKFGIAKAETNALSSEFNKLARASAAGTIDAAGTAKLQQLAGDMLNAKARTAELAEQLKGVREASGGLGGSLEEVRAGMSRAFAVTGIAAAAEGVMKVGEAIESLGGRAIEIRSMSEILGVSTSQLQAMQAAGEEAGVSMEVLARASEKFTVMLAEARNGSGKAVEQLHQLGVTTQDIASPTFQLNEMLAVLKTRLESASSAEQTRKALLQELGARTALAIEAIKEYDGTQQGVAGAMSRVNGLSAEQIERLKEMKTGWGELGTSISNAAAKALAFAGSALSAYKNAVEKMHPDMNPAVTQSGPGRVASSTGEQQGAEESARAQEAAHNEVLKSEMASIREGVAAFGEGTAQRLASLRQYAALAKQYYGSANVDEVRKANQEVAAAERANASEVSRDLVADAHQRVADINAAESGGALQRMALELVALQQTAADSRVIGEQRKQIEREVTNEIAAIRKTAVAQYEAVEREQTNSAIALAKMRLEAELSTVNLSAAASKSLEAQKLEAARALTAQLFAEDQKQLQNELSTLNQETPEYARVYGQIEQLKQKLVLDLQKLDKDAAEASKRYIQEQTTAWKQAVGEIETAEGSLVSDILNRRQNLSQSLRQIGAQMVTQEVTNDLKAFTTKMLLSNQEKALDQGGLLWHVRVEQQKAAATAAGNTAQLTSTESTQAAGQAAAAVTGGKTVMQDAAKAFSGTYASVSQIPYVGWILAPEAAAAAYAAVAGYEGMASLDVGTNYVPQNMLAQIHQGEAVVPKEYNPAAGGAAPTGGGDVHHNYGGNTINVGSNELKRMISGRTEQRHLMNALAGAYRRGARPR